MATDYDAITIIVVRASLLADAEAAAAAADPEAGSGAFSGNPLRMAGGPNTADAYWCRWNMKSSQRSAFASNMGGPINVLSVDKQPNASHDKWLFDAIEGQWTPQAVLDALGFDTFASGY